MAALWVFEEDASALVEWALLPEGRGISASWQQDVMH